MNSDETPAKGITKKKKSSYRQLAFSQATPGIVVLRQSIYGFVSATFILRKHEGILELPTVKAYPHRLCKLSS